MECVLRWLDSLDGLLYAIVMRWLGRPGLRLRLATSLALLLAALLLAPLSRAIVCLLLGAGAVWFLLHELRGADPSARHG